MASIKERVANARRTMEIFETVTTEMINVLADLEAMPDATIGAKRPVVELVQRFPGSTMDELTAKQIYPTNNHHRIVSGLHTAKRYGSVVEYKGRWYPAG
jgi:uncharacterized protein YgbK (DUF1537 family)